METDKKTEMKEKIKEEVLKRIWKLKKVHVFQQFLLHETIDLAIDKAVEAERKRVLGIITPEKLHKLYLEATKLLSAGSFNPKAQKAFKELTEEQKFIDVFIAEELKKEVSVITNSERSEDVRMGCMDCKEKDKIIGEIAEERDEYIGFFDAQWKINEKLRTENEELKEHNILLVPRVEYLQKREKELKAEIEELKKDEI